MLKGCTAVTALQLLRALLAVEGVASVKVSLDDKTAIVKPMCGTMPDIAKLKAAVDSAGYKVTGE